MLPVAALPRSSAEAGTRTADLDTPRAGAHGTFTISPPTTLHPKQAYPHKATENLRKHSLTPLHVRRQLLTWYQGPNGHLQVVFICFTSH